MTFLNPFKLASIIFEKILNKILVKKGRRIIKNRYDTDCYFISKKYKDYLLNNTADHISEFINKQKVMALDNKLNTFDLVKEFYELYVNNPNKYIVGSCGFNVLLCLYITMKHLKPDLVIESGVFIGQSTWAIKQALPEANMESFDIDLSNLKYKDPKVNFNEYDWSKHKFEKFDPDKVICFFDDHVDQVRRLLECYERGFKYVIFDDNSPVQILYRGTYGAPMFDFMFFENFKNNEVIEWSMLGKKYSYKVDLEYLKKGKSIIENYAKFPIANLSQINGFTSGYPLTIVKLKSK